MIQNYRRRKNPVGTLFDSITHSQTFWFVQFAQNSSLSNLTSINSIMLQSPHIKPLHYQMSSPTTVDIIDHSFNTTQYSTVSTMKTSPNKSSETTIDRANDSTVPIRRNPMSLTFITNPPKDEFYQPQPQSQSHPITNLFIGSNNFAQSHIKSSRFGTIEQSNLTCSKRNCVRKLHHVNFGQFCDYHKPKKLCKVPECGKCAKSGGFCIAHGGGRRCQAGDCFKSAREGGFCIRHGGGRRCKREGCTKSALSGHLCSAHGGGKRCQMASCNKAGLARGYCIAHGGGKRCRVLSCSRSAVGGQTCVTHRKQQPFLSDSKTLSQLHHNSARNK